MLNIVSRMFSIMSLVHTINMSMFTLLRVVCEIYKRIFTCIWRNRQTPTTITLRDQDDIHLEDSVVVEIIKILKTPMIYLIWLVVQIHRVAHIRLLKSYLPIRILYIIKALAHVHRTDYFFFTLVCMTII